VNFLDIISGSIVLFLYLSIIYDFFQSNPNFYKSESAAIFLVFSMSENLYDFALYRNMYDDMIKITHIG
jgi:hypothetical protein